MGGRERDKVGSGLSHRVTCWTHSQDGLHIQYKGVCNSTAWRPAALWKQGCHLPETQIRRVCLHSSFLIFHVFWGEIYTERGKKHSCPELEPQISTFSCPPVPAGDLTETINTGGFLGRLARPPSPNLPFLKGRLWKVLWRLLKEGR